VESQISHSRKLGNRGLRPKRANRRREPGSAAQSSSSAAPPAQKTIVLGINEDPGTFWAGITGGGGGGSRQLGHMVNQYLVALQANAQPTPRLLAELPSVDKGTWRVFPDGKMETVWKLRPGVTWHDGTAFAAQDIAFSVLVNRLRELLASLRF
jgi:ABC-type transport system substrate-binding protein